MERIDVATISPYYEITALNELHLSSALHFPGLISRLSKREIIFPFAPPPALRPQNKGILKYAKSSQRLLSKVSQYYSESLSHTKASQTMSLETIRSAG